MALALVVFGVIECPPYCFILSDDFFSGAFRRHFGLEVILSLGYKLTESYFVASNVVAYLEWGALATRIVVQVCLQSLFTSQLDFASRSISLHHKDHQHATAYVRSSKVTLDTCFVLRFDAAPLPTAVAKFDTAYLSKQQMLPKSTQDTKKTKKR